MVQVIITVLNETSRNTMTQVLTGSDGKYSAGPLYDDQAYKLVAHKDGYTFKHEGM